MLKLYNKKERSIIDKLEFSGNTLGPEQMLVLMETYSIVEGDYTPSGEFVENALVCQTEFPSGDPGAFVLGLQKAGIVE